MGKTFDKQAWLESKQVKLEESKKALERGLRNLETSEQWKEMLTSLAKLGQLSIGRLSFLNAVLVLSQRPETAQVATFETWRRHGRNVLKGEKALTIRQPLFKRVSTLEDEESEAGPRRLVGFRPLSVFAVEQTEGAPLPSPVPPDLAQEEAFELSVERLREVALNLAGSPVSAISIRPRELGDHLSARGWYVPATKEIVVIALGSRSMQFKVLCHELAHALLHPTGDHHSAPEREVEAESTAYVVCQALGLETGDVSFPYVATWTRGEDPLAMVARSGQRILGAAQKILDALMPESKSDATQAA